MCGICGIVTSRDGDAARVALGAMTEALGHRGPDDRGLWFGPGIGLGHRRLAVIDLAGGHQPMGTPDGRLHIVFNGEIYNFRSLRAELEAAGIPFQTQSDTEVLLHLYAREGETMLTRLVGMFALAIHDASRHRLFLARDRLGKKPLFYLHSAAGFAFASELHALRLAPGFSGTVREQAVLDYLAYQYVPAPHTVFRDVLKLPPGCSLTVATDGSPPPPPKRYWSLTFAPDTRRTFADSACELRTLLNTAVRERLIADVPLGALLSGGLDSTCVTGLMAEAGVEPLLTFSAGFPDRDYDERAYAALVARRFATEHRERVVNPCDADALRRLVRHCGEPYADASILPTHLLCRFAREHVTVVLSGDGADEVFGGYERYQALRLSGCADRVPGWLRRPLLRTVLALLPAGGHERTRTARWRRFLALLDTPPNRRYFSLVSHLAESQRLELPGPRLCEAQTRHPAEHLDAWFAAACASAPSAARAAEVDHHTYLPDDILTKTDIAAMAASLEVRSPFLDHRVVEFAAALPWEFKQQGPTRKRLLAAACASLVPAAVRRRTKKGFGVPVAGWLRGPWQPLLRDLLLAPEARAAGFFVPATVTRLVDEHVQGRADHSHTLWSLLVFELWRQELAVR